MPDAEQLIEKWRNRLLDLGKRNRLINYRETKRSNIKIISPEMYELYNRLVLKEEKLEFPYSSDDDFDKTDDLLEASSKAGGDLLTDRSVREQQKTLRSIRSKARTALEEQGVNILYLSFGFLHWKETGISDKLLVSPIILVPTILTLESITSPYVLGLHEEEIVVNPTLLFKLENDFGVKIPDFVGDEEDIKVYFNTLSKLATKNGWKVTQDVGLSLLSFLKINMYKDLERNKDRLLANPIVKAWSGDRGEIVLLPDEFNNFDHDQREKPIDIYQVLDADSSQQDAILYSKKGVSFVLQGPPGTGKSQTITNIIAEEMASGKKILFVSEKMAALEVVFKRLTQTGLADFCLPLHSHRANKKEVLNELGRTLALDKIRLHEDIIYQLNLLSSQRDRLNQYDKELHETYHPLNKTIYDVNGFLAALCYAPDITFSLNGVGETTSEKLNEYKHVINEFARTIGIMSSDYSENPWGNCHIPNVSHELRQDIETNLRALIPALSTLADNASKTVKDLGLEFHLSLSSINKLVEVLEVSSKSPKAPVTWLDQSDISPLFEKAKNYRSLKIEYHKLGNKITQNYSAEFFNLPAKKVKEYFNSSISRAKQFINKTVYTNDEKITSSAQDIVTTLQVSLEQIRVIKQVSNYGVTLLGIKELENLKEARDFGKVLESILSNPRPTDEWFETDRLTLLKRLLTETKNIFEDIDSKTNKILARFDREIFDLDYREILKRFRTEYNSIWKIFKRRYREDVKAVKLLAIETNNRIDDKAIIEILSEIKGIAEKRAWISEKDELLTDLFGNHYKKEYTDWEVSENAVTNFEIIFNFFKNKGVHQKTRDVLKAGGQAPDLEQMKEHLEDVWTLEFPAALSQVLDFSTEIETIQLMELESFLKMAIKTMIGLTSTYETIRRFCTKELNYEELLGNLSKLVVFQSIKAHIEAQSENLKVNYRFLFNGIDTDWDHILNSLSWVSDFKGIKEKYKLSPDFITRVCEDTNFIKLIKKHFKVTKSDLAKIQNDIDWYLSLFDNEQELSNLDIYAFLTRVEHCLDLSALEEWIDFRSSREKCREVGLSDFINKVQTMKINSNLIEPAFMKRFYRLWLDSVLPNFPAVNNFRRRAHEELIKDFSVLDRAQLSIARSRVRESLVSKLPDLNRFTYSNDEVGILKRELGKQRRIIPLRKLFRAIPNLLLTLKPCLMMSPLSVSLFLDADHYKFDLVIFDEASQVCTEDAVGSILRGSQVIITGDSKQLPPTNFFTASTSDNEFDVDDFDDDDYDDTDAYESVLEEATVVLPERTLRWHYRSHHESLIAFSNQKIYNNNLITFPSPITKEESCGVEYIPVPDGVYDRGGKRNNVNEAKKVAELVFDHIQRFPKRSLGVVTFSEAQQQSVEMAVRQLRLLNQYMEDFFYEDKEEPFFIKNLENVQGDERDTIIISIGYAKDRNGSMSMNFGPINHRSGGYRRLNVAITRAKHNVKLVGSIDPCDIAVDNTSSEGVKLLRSYLEFAKYGDEVLYREITVPQSINTESQFEEAVYGFLSSKGYSLASQVGCSGYRIDLAVKHPTISDRFVLGIECDGAAYHSARTARERDRLRQAVLEDNGWKIYRIWSTDWIKDPVTEGHKLCDAVDFAINSYSDNDFWKTKREKQLDCYKEEATFEVEILHDQHIKTETDEVNPYNFDFYQEANIFDLEQTSNDYRYLAEVLKHVVSREYPIHIDLLSKRVAPVFDRQKATAKIKENVAYFINVYMEKEIKERNGFYWPKNRNKAKVRIPSPDGAVRKIEHVSVEEIAEAMYVVVNNSFGIYRKDLYVTTARVFGYNRTGTMVTKAMQTACDFLVRKGRVTEIGEKISPNCKSKK